MAAGRGDRQRPQTDVRLMAVHAHPDDESSKGAATMARYVREGIEVRVTESVEVPIVMEVGAVSETVQVTAETPLLTTTDASQGTVIEDRAVVGKAVLVP
mgnify:CR=1 FL=1